MALDILRKLLNRFFLNILGFPLPPCPKHRKQSGFFALDTIALDSLSRRQLKNLVFYGICPECCHQRSSYREDWYCECGVYKGMGGFTHEEKEFLLDLESDESSIPTGLTYLFFGSNMVVGKQRFSIHCSERMLKKLILPTKWSDELVKGRKETLVGKGELEDINKRQYVLIYIGDHQGINFEKYPEEHLEELRRKGFRPASIEEVMLFLLINKDNKVLTGRFWPDYRLEISEMSVVAPLPDQEGKIRQASLNENYALESFSSFYPGKFLFWLDRKPID